MEHFKGGHRGGKCSQKNDVDWTYVHEQIPGHNHAWNLAQITVTLPSLLGIKRWLKVVKLTIYMIPPKLVSRLLSSPTWLGSLSQLSGDFLRAQSPFHPSKQLPAWAS
jgi:hypothetical protein